MKDGLPEESLVFLGSKRLGLKVLRALLTTVPTLVSRVITCDDFTDSRSCLDEFRSMCQEVEVPLDIVRNQREAEAHLESLTPSLGIVCGWYWMFSPHALRLASRGFIGVHNSILPRYRGGAPLIWALLADEPEVGVSLFTLTDGMDDGDVWGIVRTPVSDADTIDSILLRLETLVVEYFALSIGDIVDGRVQPVPQDHAIATFGAMRIPEDGRIDWTKPARYLFNFVRAQTRPYPGAFTTVNGRKLTVWAAEETGVTYYSTPGQVVGFRDEGTLIGCGDSRCLLLTRVEVEGEECTPRSVLGSLKLRLGG